MIILVVAEKAFQTKFNINFWPKLSEIQEQRELLDWIKDIYKKKKKQKEKPKFK